MTLCSDFGDADAYVAQIKARLLIGCPAVRIVDISHAIGPQDVTSGSFLLERAIAAFPPGTIHLAVVDPGVGTRRRILLARLAGQMVICPDNGLITWAWRRHGPGTARSLAWRPRQASPTFHGRDIMAPAAAMLAAGTPAESLAPKNLRPVLLDLRPARRPLRQGKIIHIDHFGNAITNVTEESLGARRDWTIEVAALALTGPRRTYADVKAGRPLALIGSSGLLEIAVRNGNAAKSLGLRVGDRVRFS